MNTFIRGRIDSLYARERALDDGLDPELPTSEALRFIRRKALERARGLLHDLRGSYLGRDVVTRGKKQIWLGRGVSIGDRVQIDALSKQGIYFGDSVTIDTGAILRASGVLRHLGVGIRIGERTAIGAYNVILGQGGIAIGQDCLLGPNVCVVSENHNFNDVARPIREQGESRLPTTIGNDVWIGANSVVLGGAIVGDGVVVAAGSVVRGEIPPFSVVAGAPARVIRNRLDV
ncbi:DapH/DapD/GlmU-related protein [Cnuibacter sp. UC19_7]|uniref:acyltransferase n=1 Tax=Cnuibacter sp. UC19_7 TaxID=3350166 RepID=UPI003671D84C